MRLLLDELATVRLRESRPGVYRLDHDAGEHDARAVALGLAALALTERAEGRGGLTSPTALPRVTRTLHDARPAMPTRLAVRQAVREQTGQRRAGLFGLLLPGSANDPKRVRGRR